MNRSEAVRQLVQLGLQHDPNAVPFVVMATEYGARLGFTNAQLATNARCKAFYERYRACFEPSWLHGGVFLVQALLPPEPASTQVS